MSLEQPDVELELELLKAAAQSRLGQAECERRTTGTAGTRDRDEIAQMVKLRHL